MALGIVLLILNVLFAYISDEQGKFLLKVDNKETKTKCLYYAFSPKERYCSWEADGFPNEERYHKNE